ncbi:Transcription factor GTE9 [Ananas comosus]|uniref:Transcription factor GTE9 n=1 Tax=Ananas comosus TaxID=4615 RepID=A0A199VTT6_ANACO|nr:Transcription factor GTE9 [Ananas comosus]
MMGKTQKFSKGFSSGFVPDYRHAVETVGESEGFASPARIDSEDSCAPKRKCISLNSDRCDGFNVPLQVISLSKMSGSERKELEMRLRGELEQTRILQKRLLSKSAAGLNGVALSSSSDVHVKKQDSVLQHSSQSKRENSESAKPAPPPPLPPPPPPPLISNAHVMMLKQCESLLKRLMAHQYGWVFNTPVDVVKLNIPDYYQVIKHPMDLGTVKSRITSGAYSSPSDFVSDVRLTFTNAMTYNPPGNDVHIMANTMSKFFETRWKPIEKKLAAADAALKRETQEAKPVLQSKKRKEPPVNHDIALPERTKPKMTDEQKLNLSRQLEPLVGEMPDHIVDFLRSRSKQTSEDEIEIDIDSLSDDTLFELQKLVDDYLEKKRSENHAKAEPCEMEILNESGLSNSSMHHGKDSVSTSSSGSRSDVKVSSPTKENARNVAVLNQEKNDTRNPLDTNRSSNGLDKLEQDPHLQHVSVEGDRLTEGENAPSERQVSPDKLYRAAVLKNRFVDTILKAREKTLNQGDKKDPEKVRREREELERQKREAEKARLQAEAKAAEDARKQAEAEAAAEAKRKRELEREAARQALLQMEKTVEINEGSLFLKDLEMLRTVAGEHVPSSVGETSPTHSHEGLVGFKLGGSNPLEQLGLYMKVDDEEEEEAEHKTATTVNDVEEGEID